MRSRGAWAGSVQKADVAGMSQMDADASEREGRFGASRWCAKCRGPHAGCAAVKRWDSDKVRSIMPWGLEAEAGNARLGAQTESVRLWTAIVPATLQKANRLMQSGPGDGSPGPLSIVWGIQLLTSHSPACDAPRLPVLPGCPCGGAGGC